MPSTLRQFLNTIANGHVLGFKETISVIIFFNFGSLTMLEFLSETEFSDSKH